MAVTDDERLARDILRLPGLVGTRVQGFGLIAAAQTVRTEALRLVPRKTEALANSIRAQRRPYQIEGRRVPGAIARIFAGGKGARHVNLVEYGTVNARAQAFLRPALIGTRDQQLTAAVARMRGYYARLQGQFRRQDIPQIIQRLL